MYCSTKLNYPPSLLLLLMSIVFCTLLNSVQCQNGADEDLLNWEAPEEFQKKYPYYLSGYDKSGTPVWVIQYGKWDVRTTVEEGGKLSDELEKWTAQMWERISGSPNSTTDDDDDARQYFGIADLDGYDLRQITHLQTVQKHLALVRQFATVVHKKGNFKKAIVINSNFLFQSLWNLIKPLLGGIATNIDLYGTNSDQWKPVLLKYIAKNQLPEFLGGEPGHRPVKAYG